MRTSENFCNFFMNAHRHIRSPHIHIFYKEFIERKCKKKQIMLEAWSERMEGFEKKKNRATVMVYEKNHIVCGNIYFMCAKMGKHTHTHNAHDERIWMILSFARCFHDRKCVWDGEHLLTRYDKPPKHFQFWSTHIFFSLVDGWPPSTFIIRFFFCASAVTNSVLAFNFFFLFFLHLYLQKPIFHHELTKKIKYLKLHTGSCRCCCYCCWYIKCISRMENLNIWSHGIIFELYSLLPGKCCFKFFRYDVAVKLVQANAQNWFSNKHWTDKIHREILSLILPLYIYESHTKHITFFYYIVNSNIKCETLYLWYSLHTSIEIVWAHQIYIVTLMLHAKFSLSLVARSVSFKMCLTWTVFCFTKVEILKKI